MDLIQSYFYCNNLDVEGSLEALVYLENMKKFFIKKLESITINHQNAAIVSLVAYDMHKLKKMDDNAVKELFGNISLESLQVISDVSYVI